MGKKYIFTVRDNSSYFKRFPNGDKRTSESFTTISALTVNHGSYQHVVFTSLCISDVIINVVVFFSPPFGFMCQKQYKFRKKRHIRFFAQLG